MTNHRQVLIDYEKLLISRIEKDFCLTDQSPIEDIDLAREAFLADPHRQEIVKHLVSLQTLRTASVMIMSKEEAKHLFIPNTGWWQH